MDNPNITHDENIYTEKWWFVFRDRLNESWFDIFTNHREGFGHVFCMTQIGDQTLVVDPKMGRVLNVIYNQPTNDMIKELKARGCRIVFALLPKELDKYTHRGLFITCASHVAYNAGFDFMGFTPYQLFKKLIKKGAIEI